MHGLTEQHISTIKDAARKLTGAKRRAFEAQVTLDYLGGSARKAETVFGWRRETVELGMNELRTEITCRGNFSARGNRKTELNFCKFINTVYRPNLPQVRSLSWERTIAN